MTEAYDRIAVSVAFVTEAATTLNVEALDLNGMTWEETAEVLKALVEARKVLQSVESGMERWIAQVWRNENLYGDIAVEGIGVVSVHRGKSRKAWDHEGIAGHVIDAHLTGGSGEMPTPWEVKNWLLDAAGIAYWRVTSLKELGIDVDEFCDTLPGTLSVTVT